jgi:hypothetical protein
MKFGYLTTGGVLASNAAQLLGGVPKSVTVFTLTRVPSAAFGSHTHVPLASLPVSLRFSALPHCHSRAHGEKLVRGDGAILAAEGSTTGLYRPVPTQNQARSRVRLAPVGALH